MTISRKIGLENRGFTLVEMLLVLAILAILAGIVYPNLARRSEQARVVAARQQIGNLSMALQSFEVDNGHFPSGRNGLQALVAKPGDAANWNGPYLDRVPLDPWKNAYVYDCPGKHNVAKFDLMSLGPDGRVGGGDDVCSWEPAP